MGIARQKGLIADILAGKSVSREQTVIDFAFNDFALASFPHAAVGLFLVVHMLARRTFHL